MSGHTPGPWAVHPMFPGLVVPASDVEKKNGCAVDPDVEHQLYAKRIHRENGTSFPRFHRSRVVPEEAKSNARLIAAAPDLSEAADALARELEHWIEWKNGNAMPPQREKGRDALRIYREAKAKAKGEGVAS